MPPSCLIIDDNASFLDASRALLQGQGMSVIGMATTASEGLQLTADLRPDVVLIDIDLGAESGFELAHKIADGTATSAPAVILISTHLEVDFADLIAESRWRSWSRPARSATSASPTSARSRWTSSAGRCR
jgi:DNA-binding NarL/FixJ family response regulator